MVSCPLGPCGLHQLQHKEDDYRAAHPSWMDQEVAPDDIRTQWQEARANRRMQFKVGDYKDSNIRMLTGTIKADWIQLLCVVSNGLYACFCHKMTFYQLGGYDHSVSYTTAQLTEGRSARDQPKQPPAKKKNGLDTAAGRKVFSRTSYIEARCHYRGVQDQGCLSLGHHKGREVAALGVSAQ